MSGSRDETIKILGCETGKCLKTLKGHTNWITQLQLAEMDQNSVWVGDKTIKTWNLKYKTWNARYGKCLKTLKDILGPLTQWYLV